MRFLFFTLLSIGVVAGCSLSANPDLPSLELAPSPGDRAFSGGTSGINGTGGASGMNTVGGSHPVDVSQLVTPSSAGGSSLGGASSGLGQGGEGLQRLRRLDEDGR